jgi:hypothetical protein
LLCAFPQGAEMSGDDEWVSLWMRVDRPGHLMAVAVMSALADGWSVLDPVAPSARLAEAIQAAGPGVLSRIVLPWPMLGTASIDPIMGAGDVVFMSLYIGAARAHMLSLRRMWLALTGTAVAALALLLVLQQPLPLLPLMAVAVVLCEPRARELEGRDRRVVAILTAGVLLALLVRSL